MYKKSLLLVLLSLVLCITGCQNRSSFENNDLVDVEQNSREYESASVVDFTVTEETIPVEETSETAELTIASSYLFREQMTFDGWDECHDYYKEIVANFINDQSIGYIGEVSEPEKYDIPQLMYYVTKDNGLTEIYLVNLYMSISDDGKLWISSYSIQNHRDIFVNNTYEKLPGNHSTSFLGGYYDENGQLVTPLISERIMQDKALYEQMASPDTALKKWFNLPKNSMITDYFETPENMAELEIKLSDSEYLYLEMRRHEGVYYPAYLGKGETFSSNFKVHKKQIAFLDSLSLEDLSAAETDLSSYVSDSNSYRGKLYLFEEAGDCKIYSLVDTSYIVFNIGDAICYKDIAWITPEFILPHIEGHDYDQDGETEYILVTTPYYAENVHADEMYYLDYLNGEITCTRLDSQNFCADIKDVLETSVSAKDGAVYLNVKYKDMYQGSFDITHNLKAYAEEYGVADYEEVLEEFGFGELQSILADEDEIKMTIHTYLRLKDKARPVNTQIVFDVYLKWDGNGFDVGRFEAYEIQK